MHSQIELSGSVMEKQVEKFSSIAEENATLKDRLRELEEELVAKEKANDDAEQLMKVNIDRDDYNIV